jgi:hypothetical protein
LCVSTATPKCISVLFSSSVPNLISNISLSSSGFVFFAASAPGNLAMKLASNPCHDVSFEPSSVYHSSAGEFDAR